MAFKLVSSGGGVIEPTIIELEATATTPIAIGDLVTKASGETTAKRLQKWNVNVGCYRAFGIACNAVASGTGLVKVIPINELQMWEADTTAATSASYVGFNAGVTGAYVDNATDASGTTGVFLIIGNVGLTGTDNRCIGRFNRVPNRDI
jgi:hypothetical protein